MTRKTKKGTYERKQVNSEEARMDKIKILIVEDSITQAMQLQHILEENGYETVIAANGREALQSIGASKPSIVISDIVMPEMDGYELCRQIKSSETYRDISVILLTALSQTASGHLGAAMRRRQIHHQTL